MLDALVSFLTRIYSCVDQCDQLWVIFFFFFFFFFFFLDAGEKRLDLNKFVHYIPVRSKCVIRGHQMKRLGENLHNN